MRTSSVLCRSVWLAVTTSWSPGQRRRVAPRSGEQVVVGQQVVDVAGQPHPGGHQHDQVVADPLQVGHQVRRQDHAHALVHDGLHQALQELPPGERVEAGDRLVEDQQLAGAWPRPGSAPAAPAGRRRACPPSARGSRPSSSIRAVGQRGVPAGVEARAEPEVVGDAQRGVGGGVLGDEPDPPQLLGDRGRARRRAPAIVPVVGASRPTARFSSVDLPAPLGPTSPTTRPAGISRVQSDSAQRAPVPLAQAQRSPGRRSRYACLGDGPKRGVEQRLDALVVQPGRRGP